MCYCKDIEMGSYNNQVKLLAPGWSSRKFIYIDTCLANEIMNLWASGIQTTGCCCGHNKLPGYIEVINKDIPTMLALGYKIQFNNIRPTDRDTLYVWSGTIESC